MRCKEKYISLGIPIAQKVRFSIHDVHHPQWFHEIRHWQQIINARFLITTHGFRTGIFEMSLPRTALLPQPPQTVQLSVMEVEDWI